jgi:tight adherence protein B
MDNTMTILLLISVPVFAIVMTSVLLLNRYLSTRQKTAMEGALRETRSPTARALIPILMAPGKMALSGVVARLHLNRKLDLLIRQAGVSWTVTGVYSTMGVCAACGVALGIRAHGALLHPALSSAVLAIGLGLAPLVPLRMKRATRLKEFEKQLPDALDFLARAMRAGHAFSISLKIMAEESPDPLGQEFRKLCAEYNLGAPLPAALDALLTRVPLLDLQFFSAAVTLQRQTGGNISEVMLRLSQVIRERFSLRGKVKATSAHGRLTGMVLTAMPVCIAIFLMITSPQYLGLLLKDPLGKYMILGVIAGQIAGYICIQKIVDFEV